MALWRIRATVDDRPGYLSVLTASLALRGVNILSVQVHTTEKGAVDDFLVDAPDALTETDLVAAVERGRGRDCWVARSEARVLVDQPTRVLGLAGRLVRDPDALGELLCSLLAATEVTWRPVAAPPRHPAGQPGRHGFGAETMWLPDPGGGSFEVSRSAPAFTPAEYARAQALVDLAAAAAERAVDRVTLVLPDGTEIGVRPAVTDDLSAVLSMHRRCSPRSRRRRYPTGAGPTEEQVARSLVPATGVGLIASIDGPDGDPTRVVAQASLVAEGDLAEVTLLVEDAWQRRGIGSALLRRLVAHARSAGHAALVVHTQADNAPMLRILDRVVPAGRTDRDGPLVTATVPLIAGGPVAPAANSPAAAGA